MPAFDIAILPAPLPRYFSLQDQRQAAGLFSSDAVVKDEGETHRGLSAIGVWLDRVERRYRPRYRVQESNREGDRIIVTVEVSGTFPGSPAILRQAFTLDASQRIASLETL